MTSPHEPRTGVLAELVSAIVRVAATAREAVAVAVARAGAVVTPLGWGVAAGIPLALGLGLGLGWLEFVAVGWAGLALAVIAVVYLIGRPRIEVALALPRRRVVAGEAAVVRLAAENAGVRRSLATTVEVPVGEGLAELVVPGLRAGEVHESELALPTARRGVIAVGPVRSIRADPVGLVRRELVWGDELSLIVHPRTIAAPSTSTGLIHDLEGSPTRDLSASDLAFHALREYQPGDERRYIHWKSSAKTGTYMVRQFEQSRRSHLAVALSLASADYADDDEFELAVSAAASLGVRAIRDGRSVSVAVSGTRVGARGRLAPAVRELATHRPDALLDELALVEHSERARDIREVARLVSDLTDQVSLAFLVCGSRATPAALRSAANAFALDVAVVAVVCDPEAQPGLRRVGGIDVLAVGLLDDLRMSLARTAAVR